MKKIFVIIAVILLLSLLVVLVNFNFSDSKIHVKNVNRKFTQVKNISDENFENKIIKLLRPAHNKIYFGAFPDFGGPEDNVSIKRIKRFEALANKKIAWAYFSQNWFNGIKYPKNDIHEIINADTIPFVRLMPRSDEEQFHKEIRFSMQNIIDGQFDKELRRWAKDAKKDFEETQTPLLIDFAVEPTGDWFSWSGVFNDAGQVDGYGDLKYPDGPERYRDAYRHIIDIFRDENITHVTWFFHVDINSEPNEWWNQAKYYYPGDEYIDWIGISCYGPQNSAEGYWETFSDILKERYKSIYAISSTKPFALLEFGVTDKSPLGKKDAWLQDAFDTIITKKHLNFSAISYWNENWEEEDNVFATIRVDSSKESLSIFRVESQNKIFISRLQFSNITKSSGITTNNLYDIKNTNITDERFENRWYKPKPEITWQWQLTENLNLNYAVDLYDVDLETTSKENIEELHNKGIKVICYFNGGAYEPYRVDSEKFPKEVLGKVMAGWEDERWLDISNYQKFAGIMTRRLDLAVEKGCDGVEPDNIHAYQEDTGFPLTYNDQLEYNKWLANEAHKRGLSIALKNDGEQVSDLIDYFDFAVVEECFQYDECKPYTKFIQQGKAVLEVEYELSKGDFCDRAKSMNFSSLKMDLALDGKRESCK